MAHGGESTVRPRPTPVRWPDVEHGTG
jgi:hypothetical protein